MKSTSLAYRSIRAVLKAVGTIELHEWPLPFLKKARGFDIGGAEQRTVMNILEKGDILLGRYTHHLTSLLIPGSWDHAAVYIGGGKAVHITGDGVSEQDVLEFMERDGIAVLKLPKKPNELQLDKYLRLDICRIARQFLEHGAEYDFLMDFKDSTRLSCSELVRQVLIKTFDEYSEGVFGVRGIDIGVDLSLKPTWIGSTAFTPDDIFKSGLVVAHESKAWRKAQKAGS